MRKTATAKKGQAIRKARAERQARNRAARMAERRQPYSLANPPAGFTMSVEDLAELLGSGRNQAYEAVRQGTYPSVRVRKGAIKVLTAPTLAILRGEMPPGPATPPAPIAERRKPAAAERRAEP